MSDNPQTTDNHERAKEWIRLEAVMRELRGLEDALLCRECQGWGVTVYGSTATWHGGVGGQTMTQGVCNKCWGSGNADRPWPSHRLLERTT